MTLDEAMDQMMTCATAHVCPREEACFEVVKWARERRADELTAEASLRAEEDAEIIDEISHYAPHFPPVIDWELARPDWSAA